MSGLTNQLLQASLTLQHAALLIEDLVNGDLSGQVWRQRIKRARARYKTKQKNARNNVQRTAKVCQSCGDPIYANEGHACSSESEDEKPSK